MFDLDIRIMGKKQSRQLYTFQKFDTHEECISSVLKCIELVTNFMECDDMEVKFTSHVTTPDVISLYKGEHHLCAVFRIIERPNSGQKSSRQDNQIDKSNYQDRRNSLSLAHETIQEGSHGTVISSR